MALNDRPTNELLKRYVFLANTRGIIPNPVTAERINKSNQTFGATSAEVYKVLTGNKLYIASAWLSSRLSADAVATANFVVYDNGDNLRYYIFQQWYDVAGHQIISNQYVPGLELLVGWYVNVGNDHANVDSRAGISGWIEDV